MVTKLAIFDGHWCLQDVGDQAIDLQGDMVALTYNEPACMDPGKSKSRLYDEELPKLFNEMDSGSRYLLMIATGISSVAPHTRGVTISACPLK